MDLFGITPFQIFVVGFALLIIVTIYKGVKTVPQAEEWTVERFGRFTHVLKPGLHIIIPFVDSVSHKISMRETVLDIPAQDVITLDNAAVTADGIVFFQVVDAPMAAYEVRGLERAITNLSMTNLRSVVGSMSLDDVLSKRDEINNKLLRVVDAATNAWGLKVTRIEIRELAPPRDLVEAMAKQMKAEREKRANILSAEGDKLSAVLRAEGAKQSAILEAEGGKQAAILEAEGRREAAYRDAEAREREAQAEASATASVSKAISEGNVQAVNYFVAQRYVDALRDIATAPNQKLIMLPLEASSILGSLAGIGQLAKETFGKED